MEEESQAKRRGGAFFLVLGFSERDFKLRKEAEIINHGSFLSVTSWLDLRHASKSGLVLCSVRV